MYTETVDGKEAKEIYDDVRQLCRKVNINNPDIKDEDLVRRVLGRNLITRPINEGEPFDINNSTTRDVFRGQDFSVESLILTPKDTINGGRYDIEFIATNSSGEFIYKLDVSITECPSMIQVNKARIEAV